MALAEYVAENTKIQELDLRDNSIRLGGLLALVQSMKVNQSVTKLKLDKRFPKESAGDADQRRQLLDQISEYSDRNYDIYEKKKESEAAEEGFDLDEDEEIYSEPVSKLLSLWSHVPSVRPTTHPPITVSSAAESPPEPLGWQTIRGTNHYHHHLRSPQPSPSSSPIPSPTRSRFHVTRVFQEVDSGLASTASGRSTPISTLSTSAQTPTISGSRVKFIVTPVTDAKYEETLLSSTSDASSPSAEEGPKVDGEESSDNDSVFLDQTEIAAFSPSSSSTLELNEDAEDKEVLQDDCNNNGDRDSGIYLLDLSNDDFYANSNCVTVVPNDASEHSTNNELIDRLLQDSSVPACEGIMVSLVDVDSSFPWTDQQANSAVDISTSGIDFLTGSELNINNWVSENVTTGDLITFNELVEPGDVWLNDNEQTSSNGALISNDNSGSIDGGESSGSSDSGVTESIEGELPLLGDSSTSSTTPDPVNETDIKTTIICASEDESASEKETPSKVLIPKLQNGYRTISTFQVENERERKRTRTPGCAGSKETDSLWTE